MSKWQDPALQERLADASASGLSAGDIARLIGETRAAVDCAMRRYGLYADSRRRQGQNRQQVK